jgi:hypothetical protein
VYALVVLWSLQKAQKVQTWRQLGKLMRWGQEEAMGAWWGWSYEWRSLAWHDEGGWLRLGIFDCPAYRPLKALSGRDVVRREVFL